MNNNDIYRVVQDFREHADLAHKNYPWFPKQYPRLYSMCTSPAFDMNVLQKMLDAKQQMENSEVSEHEASVNVGQVLVDKYVKPFV